MIRKKREKPMKLLKTEALFRRMPEGHPKRLEIEHDKARLSAGFKGEQSLDYHLNFIPSEPFFILHDLRLDDKVHFFQIDTLLLHPSFFLIIEVKNFTGTLNFDPLFDQMIRTKNGEEEVFPDPVRQVKRQAAQLETWLANHNWVAPSVESVVVIANSSALLKTDPSNQAYLEKVIRDTKLVEMIKNFSARHRKPHFTLAQLRKIATQLVRGNTPLDPDVLTQYGIAPSDLVTGVRCPDCGGFGIERVWGKWVCSRCECESRDAHFEALRDYSLLVAPTITNRQARDFLRVPSSSTIKRLMYSLDVRYCGTNKGRKYDLTHLSM